jgi:pimeloyl-ACP methyl ester carboxylesterase
MPAPAGSNVGREGSIAPSIAELVTFESGHFSTKTADFRKTLFTRYRAAMPEFHVETIGSGPRVVLVHGSVGNGSATWESLRPLADRYTLVIPDRPGYPPNPPLERSDFELQADVISELLQPGDHLVGHSYGGVISLLAAAQTNGLRSLTVSEPPAFGVARGNPAVEEFLAKMRDAPDDPREYLVYFLPLVGSSLEVSDPLEPTLEAGARAAMVERPPHEAEIPLDELAKAPFPKLVVTGGHNPVFDAVADVLEQSIGAQRAVVTGAGHSIPRAAGFDETLVRFLESA